MATFGTLRKDLNIGYGRQLRTHMVTAVTVRGTHRRQGLLRRMMTEDLAAAKADGLAMAALTASEGSIYGRFGYGVATFERSIKVDTGPRFRLRHAPAGTVEIADRKVLLELAPGSVRTRPPAHARDRSSGRTRTGSASPAPVGRDGSEDEAIRCALHYDAAGAVDGYVSYKFAGWDTKPYTMEIVDLVAATDAAYLELWQFLGSIDLWTGSAGRKRRWTTRWPGRWRTRAASSPRTTATCSGCGSWTPAKALAARRYSADGALVLRSADALGFAGGTFTLEVSGGEAHVTAGSGGLGAGPVPGRRGPRLHLSGRRLSRDPEGRRPDHRARGRGGAESAAHVRRRTRAALPDAFLTAFRARRHRPSRRPAAL